MAWYDFRCDKCGAEFEKDMPMGSAVKPKCPSCGSARTSKIFSAAGIAFKGSGFYVTDSRGKSGPHAGGSSSTADASKKDKAAPDSSSNTKPAADQPGTESSPAVKESSSPSKPADKHRK